MSGYDDLSTRMKTYEAATHTTLPRRTHTIIRVEGKAFHTFTAACKKPWDTKLQDALQEAMLTPCRCLQGVAFGYQQSDEISLLLTDFASAQTQMALGGDLQKLCSVAASTVTATFNALHEPHDATAALFDARVFTIPDPVEVENYFVWRQKDCERDSVMSLAGAYYSDHALSGKSRAEQHDMIYKAGDNWNNWPEAFRRGTVAARRPDVNPAWQTTAAPVFTSEEGRRWLREHIPARGY